MLDTLKQVKRIYTDHYAPLKWKKDHMGTDLNAEYERISSWIVADKNISTRHFQNELIRFVSATRDYHASIGIYSTESAELPITVVSAGKRYFLAEIDRSKLSNENFGFSMGDEIVEFDGKPITQMIEELRFQKYLNIEETDQKFAEIYLTHRYRRLGADVPKGSVTIGIKKNDRLVNVTLNWAYEPEEIPDVPPRHEELNSMSLLKSHFPWPRTDGANLEDFLPMAHMPDVDFLIQIAAYQRAENEKKFMMGARKSFVPELGAYFGEAAHLSFGKPMIQTHSMPTFFFILVESSSVI